MLSRSDFIAVKVSEGDGGVDACNDCANILSVFVIYDLCIKCCVQILCHCIVIIISITALDMIQQFLSK
jgi:hypothetical protein